MILIFDTETTGKYSFGRPATDPSQPHLVSLSVTGVTDDCQEEVFNYYSLVRPEGFEVPSEASSIHGITTEMAAASGMHLAFVLEVFLRYFNESRFAIAFNSQFDRHVIWTEVLRVMPAWESVWDRTRIRCAMLMMSNIMKMPNRHGYSGYAWPNLAEAFEFVTGRKMEGAHNAAADVEATLAVVRHSQQKQLWSIAEDRVLV